MPFFIVIAVKTSNLTSHIYLLWKLIPQEELLFLSMSKKIMITAVAISSWKDFVLAPNKWRAVDHISGQYTTKILLTVTSTIIVIKNQSEKKALPHLTLN
jgi:hypothetical protein